MSAARLADLFRKWDSVVGKGQDAERHRAAIVDELTRYYPEEAGISRIAELLGIDASSASRYRDLARGAVGR